MTPAPTDLMPCPFCGAEVKLHHISEAGRSFMGPCWKTGFRVSCDKCNLDMSMADQGDALKKWNRRADIVQQWKERAYNAGHYDGKYGTPCEQIRKQQEVEMTDKMPERVGFEQWLLKEHGLDAVWESNRNCYREFGIHLAWKAWQAKADLVPRQAVTGDATDQQEDWAVRELGLLYNYKKDDSTQFTRWQMMTAINHGYRLGLEVFERTRSPAVPAEPTDKDALAEDIKTVDDAITKMAMQHDQITGNNAGIAFDRIRRALSAPAREATPTEQDISKCPVCGGVADNGMDRCLPPNPYYCTKCQAAHDKETK